MVHKNTHKRKLESTKMAKNSMKGARRRYNELKKKGKKGPKERTEAKATEDRRDWGIYLAAH